MNKRLLLLIPFLSFAGIAIFLGVGLFGDPQRLPSALLDKPVPAFELPPIEGRADKGLQTDDLKGEVTVVNIFASWCVPCRAEHPFITQMAEEGYSVHAINYKDEPQAAMQWLEQLGDPYELIGSDQNGRAGVEWGVYGVPETFIIDGNGTIVHKHVGPVMRRDLEETLRPILKELTS